MSEDLVTESGRETMTLKDRIELFENDLMHPPFLGIGDLTRAVNQAIHDLKITVGAVRSVIEMYYAAKRRGVSDEALEKGSRTMVTPYECWVLAWRRGGHQEWQRVRREQRRLKAL